MTYVLKTLQAEIPNIKRYLEYCKDRINTLGIEETTAKKFKNEIRTNRKRLQDMREAINLLKEYQKTKRN
jgi:hypothetical protein